MRVLHADATFARHRQQVREQARADTPATGIAGHEEVVATGMDYETYQRFGLDRLARLDVNGRSRADFIATLNPPDDVNYNPCPEAYPRTGTAEGALSRHAAWTATPVFAGTVRDVVVYTTPGLDRSKPANLVLIQDGHFYLAAA